MGEGLPPEEREDFFLELAAYEGVDGFVICGGTSFRDYVTRGHACIYKDGRLAHDPHPSGLGIKDIQDFLLITRAKAATE